MNDRRRWHLCLIGVVQIAAAAVLAAVGGAVSLGPSDQHGAAMALYGLAGAIGLAGHALCQSCCLPPAPPKGGAPRKGGGS